MARGASVGVLAAAVAAWAVIAAGGSGRVTVPRASAYGARPPATAFGIAIAEELHARWPELEVDGALGDAAAAYLRAVPDPDPAPPPGSFLVALLRAAGSADPTGEVVVVRTTEDDPTDLLEAADAAARRSTHVGVARVAAEVGPYRWRWAAVTVHRRLHLIRPVPSATNVSVPLSLAFRLGVDLDAPTVVVTTPSERIERIAATAASDGAWRAEIPPATAPGALSVQVLAAGADGPVVAAQMVIDVTGGDAPPPPDEVTIRWSGEPEVGASADGSPLDAALEMANRFRIAHGRPALVPDPVLARIALDHAEELAVSGTLTHRSATGGELPDRLRDAGYRFRAARENLARAATVTEAHRSLVASPSHRANLLADEVSAIGVGVVSTVTADGRSQVVLTQVLAAPLRVPPAAEVLERGLQLLHGTRSASNRSPELDAAAGALAALPELLALTDDELFDELRRRLDDRRPRWRRLSLEIRTAGEPSDLEPPRSPDLLAAPEVGVGAAVLEPAGEPPLLQVVWVGGERVRR